jgi:hypothetical protein
MSRDKYSNDHTIELLNIGSDFTAKTNQGTIYLTADGSNGDVVVSASDDLVQTAGDTVLLRASEGRLTIKSEKDHISLESKDRLKLEAEDRIIIGAGYPAVGWSQGNEGDIILLAKDDIFLTAEDNVKIVADDKILLSTQINGPGGDLDDYDDGDVALEAAHDLYLKADNEIVFTAPGGVTLSGSTLYVDSLNVDGNSNNDIIDWDNIDLGEGAFNLICASNAPGIGFNVLRGHSSGGGGGLSILSKAFGVAEFGGVTCNLQGGIINIGTNDGPVWEGEIEAEGEDQAVAIEVNIAASNSVEIAADYTQVVGSSGTKAILRVDNLSGGVSAGGISIGLNTLGLIPGFAGREYAWATFEWDSEIKGSIQGANDTTNGSDYAWLSTNHLGNEQYANYNAQLDAQTAAGNARFVSGAADFGEFFEAGDASEWSKEAPSKSIFGLPEGIVVWAVGNKFYKTKQEGLGIPMFITKRAIVVGSGVPLLGAEDATRSGEILSFIGKLPVLVKGAVGVGDLIIPVDNENLCRGLPKSEATLQDYMKALGSSLTTCQEESVLSDDHPFAPGEKTSLHKILCAVGVK